DIADHVTLLDADTRTDPLREATQVGIAACVAAGVIDLHHVAEPSPIPRATHRPIADCPHRGARRGGIVDPIVGAIDSQDGVKAVARKGGADPAILEGGTQECATERFTLTVEVVLTPAARGEGICLVVPVVDAELHAEHAAGAGCPIRSRQTFIEYTEGVAG